MSSPSLRRRPLGRTGIEVTELALGTAPLATVFWGNDESTAVATALAAVDAGVALLDTAPLYGLGESEQRLGLALAQRPSVRCALATKVGRTLVGADPTSPAGTGDVVFDFSADAVRRQLDASLARLGRDRVDIVHVHDPEEHLDQAIAECVPALVALRDQGVIGAVSVGTNVVSTAITFIERADIDAAMVAGRLTLLDRSALLDLLPRCAAHDVPLLAAGVFNSGVLARPMDGAWFDYAPADAAILDRVRRLDDVCRDAGIALSTAALRYPLRFPEVASVVVGMSSPDEVAADVDALGTEVPDDVWAALDAVD